MTLDQFITKYNGKYVDYDGYYGAQCVDLIAYYTKEVLGVELPPHASAKDYWKYGIPGFDKVKVPQPGDIAVYDGHGPYTDGHIAVQISGAKVFEQNADPDHSPAHVGIRTNTYLLGYLRKKGNKEMITGNGLSILYRFRLGRRPDQKAIDGFIGKKTFDEVDAHIKASKEYKDFLNKYKSAKQVINNQLPTELQ